MATSSTFDFTFTYSLPEESVWATDNEEIIDPGVHYMARRFQTEALLATEATTSTFSTRDHDHPSDLDPVHAWIGYELSPAPSPLGSHDHDHSSGLEPGLAWFSSEPSLAGTHYYSRAEDELLFPPPSPVSPVPSPAVPDAHDDFLLPPPSPAFPVLSPTIPDADVDDELDVEIEMVLTQVDVEEEDVKDEVEHSSAGEDMDEVVSSPSDSIFTVASPTSLDSRAATTPPTTPEPPEDMSGFTTTDHPKSEYGLRLRRSRPSYKEVGSDDDDSDSYSPVRAVKRRKMVDQVEAQEVRLAREQVKVSIEEPDGDVAVPAQSTRTRMSKEVATALAVRQNNLKACPTCQEDFEPLDPRDAKSHFVEAHVEAEEKKRTGMKHCPWPDCAFEHERWNGVLLHMDQHFISHFECPDCGVSLTRPNSWTRHKNTDACARRLNAKSQNEKSQERKPKKRKLTQR